MYLVGHARGLLFCAIVRRLASGRFAHLGNVNFRPSPQCNFAAPESPPAATSWNVILLLPSRRSALHIDSLLVDDCI